MRKREVNKHNALVKKLNARIMRDEIKYRNKRELYTYRINGEYCDNMLMLESSSKDVHSEVFQAWYNGFTPEEKARFVGVEVVHVGTYDKLKFRLIPSSDHKVIFKA